VSITQDVVTYLLTKTGVTTHTSTRIYDGHVPQGDSYPAVTVKMIDGGHAHDIDGSAGFATPTVQIDVWSRNKVTNCTVAEAIRQVMQGFKGTMGSSTVTGVSLIGDIDLDGPPNIGTEVPIHQKALDYWIRHTESVPAL
jgi:hypothetical protein